MNKSRCQEISRRLKALAVDMRKNAELLREHGATEKAHQMTGAADMVCE